MRIIIKSVLLYFTVSSLFGCNKSTDLDFIYEETYCADPWICVQNTLNLPDPELCFEEYMDSEGISYSNYSYELENTPDACEACNCLSGYVFRFTASDEFEDELLNLGLTTGG